jgi:hypothetical protein
MRLRPHPYEFALYYDGWWLGVNLVYPTPPSNHTIEGGFHWLFNRLPQLWQLLGDRLF